MKKSPNQATLLKTDSSPLPRLGTPRPGTLRQPSVPPAASPEPLRPYTLLSFLCEIGDEDVAGGRFGRVRRRVCVALLGLLFRSLISPATYLLGLSWLQVRPTVAFRASEAGATSRLPAAQRLRVASARTRTRARARSRAPRGPSPRADAAAPVPATCRAWHLLLFGSWQLRFSFSSPIPPLPTPWSYPLHSPPVQVPS